MDLSLFDSNSRPAKNSLVDTLAAFVTLTSVSGAAFRVSFLSHALKFGSQSVTLCRAFSGQRLKVAYGFAQGVDFPQTAFRNRLNLVALPLKRLYLCIALHGEDLCFL